MLKTKENNIAINVTKLNFAQFLVEHIPISLKPTDLNTNEHIEINNAQVKEIIIFL